MKTYIIKFDMCLNGVWKTGLKIRVKNRYTELQAKIGLEAYLRRKHEGFCGLIIHDCREENPFSDIFKGWGFGG